jgi:uncharacterized membrane-anchored protein YhcB (DUF1043 family)
MANLSLDTLVPIGLVVSLLSGTGYVGATIYKVDQSERVTTELRKDVSEIKESIARLEESAKLTAELIKTLIKEH